jgi:hypothetical protein
MCALSNWDTLALDQDSAPTTGVFTSPLGVEVRIYKNWLYVSDKKAWQKGGEFVEDTVMEIWEGVLTYKDVHIRARTGPKAGVYCVVYTQQYPPPLKKACPKCKAKRGGYHDFKCPDRQPNKWTIMVGCGVDGYTSRGKWVGVGKAEVAFLQKWIQGFEISEMEMPGNLRSEMKISRTAWVKKMQSVFKNPGEKFFARGAKFYLRSRDHNFNEHVRKIDFTKALRVNQGDMFFAAHIKGLPAQPTKPGEAKPTHMSGITKAMTDKKKAI